MNYTYISLHSHTHKMAHSYYSHWRCWEQFDIAPYFAVSDSQDLRV